MVGWARIGIGLALVWGSLGVLGYRLGWQIHSSRGQAALLRSELPKSDSSTANCSQGTPASDGQLAGVLDLPTLGVTAPVEEGTDDAELNVAVGHADSTPWPGTPGTSVLLAHDVSYFAHIDQLQPGNVINYKIGCVTHVFSVIGHQVVQAGSAIPQQAGNGLVLDTCWPTNALWYTPQRYLVEAHEVSVKTSKKSSTGGAPQTWPTGYTSTAPSALLAQGLTLQNNEAPMGTLELTGTPTQAWAQSPAPLAVEAAALEAYFGGLHAADQKRADWWSVLAPSVTMPTPLQGAFISGHNSPLDVTITSTGSTPTSVSLSTDVTISGGTAPGRYQETVNETIQGLTVVITQWEVSHG